MVCPLIILKPPNPDLSTALKHGTYVADESTCADPPFAALRTFDGQGFADPHTHDCRARVVSLDGDTLTVDNDCIDAGMGEAPRHQETFQLTITDSTHFTIGREADATSYRFCPVDSLPQSLKEHAAS